MKYEIRFHKGKKENSGYIPIEDGDIIELIPIEEENNEHDERELQEHMKECCGLKDDEKLKAYKEGFEDGVLGS